jgi:hypothetical protein
MTIGHGFTVVIARVEEGSAVGKDQHIGRLDECVCLIDCYFDLFHHIFLAVATELRMKLIVIVQALVLKIGHGGGVRFFQRSEKKLVYGQWVVNRAERIYQCIKFIHL